MSVEAIAWALRVPVGGNAKVILLGLANHAHPDGREAYPALDTLAEYAACDRSTARRNVRKLLEDGWIREDGNGPRGENKYALALERTTPRGGGKVPPGQNAPGGAGASEGVAPVPPEPSLGNRPRGESAQAPARDPREDPPEGFPDELRPHAREVYAILSGVAAQHGARRVWPQAVGRVCMAHPRHPLVATAHALAAWAVDPPRPVKDVVGTYRTFLGRERELQAAERLAEDGTPTGASAAVPAAAAAKDAGRRWRTEQRLRVMRGGADDVSATG